MRLLVFGDSAGTGFGTVTRNLGKALIARGFDVRFTSLNESSTEPESEPFRGRMLSLGTSTGWLESMTPEEHRGLTEALASGDLSEDAERRLRAALEVYRRISVTLGIMAGEPDDWRADAVLIIGDPGSLDMSGLASLIPPSLPAFNYVPIEGMDIPPRWASFYQHIEPIAMTKFGAGELERITGYRPAVAYHGVDPSEFWPVSALRPIRLTGKGLASITLASKRACKEFVAHAAREHSGGAVNLDPDRLWLLRTDRHMPRKNYSSLIRSLSVVLRRHPDVEFVFHCRTIDQGGNLADDVSKVPDLLERISPTGFHNGANAGASKEALNAIYNAADIYVSNSAEGFGLTVAEAMACGIPVVALNYSSLPEVVGDAGVLVPVGGIIDNIYGYVWARPDEALYAEAVHRLVMSRGARRTLGVAGTDRVRRMFRWDQAAEIIAGRIEAKVAVAA